MRRPAFSDELGKLAASSPFVEALKHVGVGALGFGAGTAAGFGLAELASRAHGGPVPRQLLLTAAPVLATVGGVAYSVHKSRESEAVRRALEGRSDPPAR